MIPLLMQQEEQVILMMDVEYVKSIMGKPEEFAELACHIVTNGHLNGEVIRLDGALRMAPR